MLLADDTINLTVAPGTTYYNLVGLTPSRYVIAAVNYLIGGAGVLAFLYLLMGGISWIMAGSDKDAIEKARKKIIQALVGLSIVFSAYAIIFIIRILFQVNLIQFVITNI